MFFTFIPWSRAFWGFGFKLVGEPVACTKPFLKPQNLNPKPEDYRSLDPKPSNIPYLREVTLNYRAPYRGSIRLSLRVSMRELRKMP